MSDIVIKAEDVGKLYKLGEIGTGTISHDLNRWFAKMRGKDDPFPKIGEVNDRTSKGNSDWVWALKDISSEIKKRRSCRVYWQKREIVNDTCNFIYNKKTNTHYVAR